MGRIKQLLPLKSEPAIRFCLHRILEAGIGEVIVVLGNHRQKIQPHIGDLPVAVVVNEESESEMADSVKIGLAAVSQEVSGIMIHPADQPLVRIETYRLVADQHGRQPEKIIVPSCDGRGGHPTLFPASLLRRSGQSEPLNRFMRRHSDRIHRLPVDDPGVALDMDYLHEYDRLAGLV